MVDHPRFRPNRNGRGDLLIRTCPYSYNGLFCPTGRRRARTARIDLRRNMTHIHAMGIERYLPNAGSSASLKKRMSYHVDNVRRTKHAPSMHRKDRTKRSKVEPTDGQICTYRTASGMRNGEGGIRTPAAVSRRPHFECGSFSHSDTSPTGVGILFQAGRCLKMMRGAWSSALTVPASRAMAWPLIPGGFFRVGRRGSACFAVCAGR